MRLSLQFPAFLGDAAAALLFPTNCHICGAPVPHLRDGVSCRSCWQRAEAAHLNFDYCEKCAAALPRLQLQPQARRCGNCDDLAFTAARACGHHVGALRESVLRLKREPYLPAHLQSLLNAAFWQLPQAHEIELIVPTPLHPTRQQERRFNQADLIAHALAHTTALPVADAALVRVKATERHRAGMDAKARQQSLHRAFQVRAPRRLKDRTILVVDDVLTTGATAHEIAQTLCQHGTRAVYVLTLTRATNVFH